MADKKKRRHRRHGLTALRRALRGAIDPGSMLGLALAEMRQNLVADLGGDVSEAQRLVIERVIRAKLRADAAEAWLDEQPIEARLDPRVLAIEREARAQGETMVRCLTLLGLERRPRTITLEDHIAQLCAEPEETDHATVEPSGSAPTDVDEPHIPADRETAVEVSGGPHAA